MKVKSFIEMLKDDNYEETDIKIYQCSIKKLIYLLCGTKPDIVFVIKKPNKWNTDPRVGYLIVAKQVLNYFKKTIHLGITYKAGWIKPLLYRLKRYVNSNYAKDPKNYNSIIKYCFFIYGAIVS